MSDVMQASVDSRVAEIGGRIDRLPTWGITGAAKAAIATGYFFSFFSIVSIGVTLPAIMHSLHLSRAELALPLTAGLFGYMLGGILLGQLADKWGRRNTFFVLTALLATSSVLCGLSWNVASLAFFRLVSGIGIGAQISLSAALINELSPSSQRGRNIQRNVIVAGIGDAAAPLVAIALLGAGDFGWRLGFGVGIFAFIPGVLAFWLPESPRWLAAQGRHAEAQGAVAKMEARLEARGLKIPEVSATVPSDLLSRSRATSVRYRDLFRRPYLSRVAVVTAYWTLFYITAYGFLGFGTVLLNQMTIQKPHGLLITAIGYLAIPVGAALPLVLIDRIHRRYLLGMSSIIYTVGLAILAVSWNGATMMLGSILASMVLLFNAGVGYIYTTEIFPTRVRASAMGLADGGGHIGGMLAPSIVLAALSAWGPRGAFGFLAGTMAVGAVLIITLGVRRADELPSL